MRLTPRAHFSGLPFAALSDEQLCLTTRESVVWTRGPGEATSTEPMTCEPEVVTLNSCAKRSGALDVRGRSGSGLKKSVDVTTWNHSERGDTTADGQNSGLSTYRDALADVLAAEGGTDALEAMKRQPAASSIALLLEADDARQADERREAAASTRCRRCRGRPELRQSVPINGNREWQREECRDDRE